MTHIHYDEALERLGNSDMLYGKLIEGFINKYEHVILEYQQLTQRESFEEARRLAHSLKGLTANIGANHLSAISKELEYAYRDQTGDYENIISRYDTELKTVIELLREYLADSSNSAEVTGQAVADPEGYLTKLKALKSALNSFKYSEIKKVYSLIKTAQPPESYKSTMAEVASAIDGFDYKEAVEILEKQIGI